MEHNRTKPKAVRISTKVHARLLRLAALEERNAADVADRLLGAAVEVELRKLEAERAGARAAEKPGTPP